jgi:predicted GNAT family N-acyltransferase
MNKQVTEVLKRSRYKVLSTPEELESVYRLRYNCYRAEQSIAQNERGIMHDPFDDAENCLHVGVEVDGQLAASVRLHLLSKLSQISPTLEVFPEVLDTLKRGQTALDSTRFVTDPAVRQQRVPLHFLALRIPFLATMFYDIDVALAAVRPEHSPFYRRYLGYDLVTEPRSFPLLKKPVQLLTAQIREQRDTVLRHTPVFGPIDDIPQSNIAFPDMSGIYQASPDAASAAA